jgi:hypothetical protein
VSFAAHPRPGRHPDGYARGRRAWRQGTRAFRRRLPSPVLSLFYRAWASSRPTVHSIGRRTTDSASDRSEFRTGRPGVLQPGRDRTSRSATTLTARAAERNGG